MQAHVHGVIRPISVVQKRGKEEKDDRIMDATRREGKAH